nr:MAG: ORF1 [Torque teno midi virus]
MPFWWRRRNKNWWGRAYKRKRYYKYKTRRPRRRTYRRRPYGRRRRRRRRTRRKVRKKLQKITIKQWQPDSIVKCKIKGFDTIVAGAEGRQMFCYTNEKSIYTQPKAPGGGGFGIKVYNLQYLYQEWLKKNNIWTRSNDYKDLVRFTGATFTFFRSPTTDFVVQYSRQPPFIVQKDTYMNCHPQALLLSKHHRVILSTKTAPKGRIKTKIKIKPTKQMITKWFFQDEFSQFDLFQIQAAAADFSYPQWGPNTQSTNLTFYALNTNFYHNTNWASAHQGTQGYKPYTGYSDTTVSFEYPTKTGTTGTFNTDTSTYDKSISYEKGMFAKEVLNATKIKGTTSYVHERPVTIARYNPEEDTGTGNIVYFTSLLADTGWDPPKDSDLVIKDVPLYIAIYGFWNTIIKLKGDKQYMKYGMFVVKSNAIKLVTNTQQKQFPLIDWSFIQGKMPYEEYLLDSDKRFWYPTAYKQQEILNAIVECGQFIPKYSNLPSSSWQLNVKYTFYFKWGGPHITDQLATNPKDKEKYPVPDTVFQAVQIADPHKQACKEMLRAWDYRRGLITSTALKRMSENFQSDSSFQSDEGETPKKKKRVTGEVPSAQEKNQKIQKHLLSLFEESTCQEEEDLHKLIEHQQQQQYKLKQNIIHLLIDLKKQQRFLQLQSGVN